MCAISSLTSTFAISSSDEFLSAYVMRAIDILLNKRPLTYLLTIARDMKFQHLE